MTTIWKAGGGACGGNGGGVDDGNDKPPLTDVQ